MMDSDIGVYCMDENQNIFMYSTPLNNEFDIMTDRTANTMRLGPTNYLKYINPNQKKEYERYYLYYTDNEDFFWQNPIIK